MSNQEDKYHSGLEGVAIGDHAYNEIDPRCRRASRSGIIQMTLVKHSSYSLIAYPGPAVVMSGRAEHKPLQFHVKTNGGTELRIKLEDFEEYDGLLIPKPLVRYFKESGVKDVLRTNTVSVFETGRLPK